MGGKKKVTGARKKRGGLGEGGRALEIDRPMGEALGAEVEPPPPPPLPHAAPPPPLVAEPPALEEPIEGEFTPRPGDKPPLPAFDRPPAAPTPVPAKAPAAADRPVDLDLLPWVVKKQLAIDTDREDLDFEIVLWVEGKSDQLVIEGFRNDFGRIYVRSSDTPEGFWRRQRDSEFSGISSDDLFTTYRQYIVSVLVRTEGFEIEFSDLGDFLEWARY